MKGTRPLDNNEIRLVPACFDGTFEARNRWLFMLCVSTGGRISELLSLMISEVYQNGRAVTDLLYSKRIVKGGEVSRAVPVNVDGREAITALIDWHREQYGDVLDKKGLRETPRCQAFRTHHFFLEHHLYICHRLHLLS